MLAVCGFEEKHLPSSSVVLLSSFCLTSLRASESDSSPCVSSSEEISSAEEKLALIWAKSIFLAILSKIDKKREMCLVYFMINHIILSSILQQNKKVSAKGNCVELFGRQLCLGLWPHQLNFESQFSS